ncbi:hypothetical protein niasHS_007782 [Heterodera schachtii]|uniref:C2H2-type domain-containing protein n=1 Tax=Heterodera schachtii TaxID=97005 RepID=A0ABD2JQ62_HETSC
MDEANFKDARRHGIFVRSSRCPCPVKKLVATKFSKVKCKFIDKSWRPGCYISLALCSIVFLCFSVLFVFLFFTSIAYTVEQYILIFPLLLFFISILIISSFLCCYDSFFERKHSALEVLYKCDSCGHEVHKCYECFVYSLAFSTNQHRAYHHQIFRGRTYNSWGRYTRNVTKMVLHRQMTITNYEAVEQKFDLMSGVQKDSFTTSWAWANDLIRRLE